MWWIILLIVALLLIWYRMNKSEGICGGYDQLCPCAPNETFRSGVSY